MSNGSKKMNALQQQYEKEKQEKQSKQAKRVTNEITSYQIKKFHPDLVPKLVRPTTINVGGRRRTQRNKHNTRNTRNKHNTRRR